MATNPEIDGSVTVLPEPNGNDPPVLILDEPHIESQMLKTAEPVAEPVTPPTVGPQAETLAQKPRRHVWMLPATLGVAGLIASGTLGGLLWSTIGQRDMARDQLVAAQTAGQQERRAAAADAAVKKVRSDYLALVTADGGRSTAAYGSLASCKSYSECRTALQQALNDFQAFQTHRAAATVPTGLANSDAELRDALSAAIAALQEMITGTDTDDVNKFKDGYRKLDASLITIGKAEAG